MITITGGEFRGKKIEVPSGNQVRPTLNKTRQATFNVLQNYVRFDEVRVIDLYAGSGALGIEAVSRGSNHTFFVEQDTKIFQTLQKNVQSISISKSRTTLVCSTAHQWITNLKSGEHPYLIFIDPPYESEEYEKILSLISQLPSIPQHSALVVESPYLLQYSVKKNLEMVQTKKYGQTKLCFFVKC